MALHDTRGLWPVAAAIGGNFFVTVIKALAALSSGSSAMLAEAVHSFADTLNQILLLIGLRRSARKADDEFEYGYGNERFFWALISACGVLFVGAGVTAYKGFADLAAPQHVEASLTVFVVLLFALAIESYTFAVAARALRRDLPGLRWRERFSKADPATLAVLFEDAVAVVGVFVAGTAIALSAYTGNPAWDAGGSLVIAGLLGIVAVVLIVKNRSYLLGRSMPEDLQEAVRELLEAEPAVEKVIDFKSSTVGFDSYRIKCEVEFNGSALLREAYARQTLRDQYEDVHGDFDAFKRFLADYADRIPRLVGRKIDEIESRIRKLYPAIRHIDIELN